jgi:serine protease Do
MNFVKPSPEEIYRDAATTVVEIVTFDAQGQPMEQGTGFFINHCDVMNNWHVIAGASQIQAILFNGTKLNNGAVYSRNDKTDLATVRFEGFKGKSWVIFVPDSNQEQVGENLYVVGNPIGYQASITSGMLSAYRLNGALIQITAPVSPGSSGSPVFNEYGYVVGIVQRQDIRGEALMGSSLISG